MRYRLKRKTIAKHDNNRFNYLVIFGLTLLFIIFGFIVDTPKEIFIGLKNIIIDRDTLITDYIKVGGLGSAFVNSGILTLIFTIILWKMDVKLYGISFAALLSIAGFAFFGKNLFNVWFIIIGVYLYAKVKKEKFSKYIYIALFGTAMSPISTEFIFTDYLPMYVGLLLGVFLGIFIGFILTPVSTHLLKVHQGYNLYNIGFTAGLISTVIVSIAYSYGYKSETRMIISNSYNFEIGILLFTIFMLLIIIGYLGNNKSIKNYFNLWKYPGRLVTDFIILEGLPLTLINMGLCGILSTIYVLIVGGDLSGPIIGGILVIVGFSALGKHPRNIIPIFVGVSIGALTKIWDINNPSILLAALFGTSLAPIAGEFGFIIGSISAFIHLSVTINVINLHGGLNLYNNGFSAGLVAAFIIPIIREFRKEGINEIS